MFTSLGCLLHLSLPYPLFGATSTGEWSLHCIAYLQIVPWPLERL